MPGRRVLKGMEGEFSVFGDGVWGFGDEYIGVIMGIFIFMAWNRFYMD